MARYYSPLRYPGGKAFLAPFFSRLLAINEVRDGTYVEPFAGGAGAAIELLITGHVSNIILNDASFGVYAFWKAVTNNTDEFCRLVWDISVNVSTWKRQHAVVSNPSGHPDLDVGFATFFLNRTNHSGIIEGGPIGGYDQRGKWKIDARFNKKALCARLERIGLYKNRIQIFNHDAIIFFNKILVKILSPKNKPFIYLDPPYCTHGNRLYLNYYTLDDHRKLSKLVRETLPYPWVLSYEDVSDVRDLYFGLRQKRMQVLYSANKSVRGEEIMVFSDELVLADLIRLETQHRKSQRVKIFDD